MEIDSSRFVFRGECQRRNLCFYFKEQSHWLQQCRKRSSRHQRVSFYEERETTKASNDDEIAEVFDSLTINAYSSPHGLGSSSLLRKPGVLNGKSIVILFDTAADHNIIRKGLNSRVIARKRTVAERFDGTFSHWLRQLTNCNLLYERSLFPPTLD
jgi:hypothetical protein